MDKFIGGPINPEHVAIQLAEKEALNQVHRQWQEHPVTRQINKLVNRMQTKLIDTIAARALDPTLSSEQLRQMAAQLSTVKQINELINDTAKYNTACTNAGL